MWLKVVRHKAFLRFLGRALYILMQFSLDSLDFSRSVYVAAGGLTVFWGLVMILAGPYVTSREYFYVYSNSKLKRTDFLLQFLLTSNS